MLNVKKYGMYLCLEKIQTCWRETTIFTEQPRQLMGGTISKGTFEPENLGNKKNVYFLSFWPKKVLMYPVETGKEKERSTVFYNICSLSGWEGVFQHTKWVVSALKMY